MQNWHKWLSRSRMFHDISFHACVLRKDAISGSLAYLLKSRFGFFPQSNFSSWIRPQCLHDLNICSPYCDGAANCSMTNKKSQTFVAFYKGSALCWSVYTWPDSIGDDVHAGRVNQRMVRSSNTINCKERPDLWQPSRPYLKGGNEKETVGSSLYTITKFNISYENK